MGCGDEDGRDGGWELSGARWWKERIGPLFP